MANLLKKTNASIAEGKEPSEFLHSFLREYCSTPHGSTGKAPAELMMVRVLRTRLSDIRSSMQNNEQYLEVQKRDESEVKVKLYSDKRRRARKKDIKVGDHVVLKQKKTMTSPP